MAAGLPVPSKGFKTLKQNQNYSLFIILNNMIQYNFQYQACYFNLGDGLKKSSFNEGFANI
jgi:hypothetical protein